MDGFFSLPSQLLTALGVLVSFALTGGLNTDQQNSLGNLLEMIGQILLANAAQRQLLEDAASDSRNDSLQKQLQQLQARLEALEARHG